MIGIEPLFRHAQRAGEWYYLDNAYFDSGRGRFFRCGRNALQACATDRPDWARFAALGLGIQPWQTGGGRIVVCPQSESFMADVARVPGGQAGWLRDTVAKLAAHTDRPIHVRHWSRDKAAQSGSFHADLKGAWALVTHSSAAANEALIAGVPVFVTAPCAAAPLARGDLAAIENPLRPAGRAEWAATLAGLQWTVDELRDGTAWKRLHE